MKKIIAGIVTVGMMASSGLFAAALTTTTTTTAFFVVPSSPMGCHHRLPPSSSSSSSSSSSRRHEDRASSSSRRRKSSSSTTSIFFRDHAAEDTPVDDGQVAERQRQQQQQRASAEEERRTTTTTKEEEERGDDDFHGRMRSIVASRVTRGRRDGEIRRRRPRNVRSAISLEEFVDVVDEGRRDGRLVVVRFHATWCKTCHAIRPSFDRAASSNPHVIFVDVPVLETNANLHQGLGVESVPFGHIYHPERGLIEEHKLSRRTFSAFVDLVKMHSSS